MKMLCMFMCVSIGYSSTLLVPSEYTTIGAAIEASTSGDTVLVSSGVYQENIDFSGKSITLISVSGPEATEIRRDSTSYYSVVSIVSGEGEGTILEGFTITWGVWKIGGGIQVINSNALLLNNIITGNSATSSNENALGGGIYILNSVCSVVGNHIYNNAANSFDTGWDHAMGGGIYAEGSELTVANNLIEQNTIWLGATSSGEGAGIYAMSGCSGIFSNNVIASNYHQGYSSDSYGIGAPGCILVNNTIADNEGAGIHDAGEVRNCIVWGNNSEGLQIEPGHTVTYSDVQNGYTGEGNISVYPEFTSGALSDFQLVDPASPCIDAGDPAAFYYDPEGDPGLAHWPACGTVHNDMGAYGGQGASFWFDGYTGIEAADTGGGASFAAGIAVNPVFAVPEIVFSTRSSVLLEIAVFDINGRTAFRYTDNFSAGSHSLFTRELPSGVYLCRISSATESDSVRFTVIRR